MSAEAEIALAIFETLKGLAKYIDEACRKWANAEAIYSDLLDEVERCERYAYLIKSAIDVLSGKISGRELHAAARTLQKVRTKTVEFSMWAKTNMFTGNEEKSQRYQKKFRVAFGKKLEKITAELTCLFGTLRSVDREVTMQLQTLILDVTLQNQTEIVTVKERITALDIKFDNLDQLIRQQFSPPTYTQAVNREAWDNDFDSMPEKYDDDDSGDPLVTDSDGESHPTTSYNYHFTMPEIPDAQPEQRPYRLPTVVGALSFGGWMAWKAWSAYSRARG